MTLEVLKYCNSTNFEIGSTLGNSFRFNLKLTALVNRDHNLFQYLLMLISWETILKYRGVNN